MNAFWPVLALGTALTELGYLYLLYVLVSKGLGLVPEVAPLTAILIVLAAWLFNSRFAAASPTCLTILLANAVAGGVFCGMTVFLTGVFRDGISLPGMLTTGPLLLWLWIRAALLAWRAPDYARFAGIFDWSVAAIVGVLFVAQLAGISLAGWPWWVLLSLAAGVVTFALSRHGSSGWSFRAGPVVVGVSMVLVPPVLVLIAAYPWLADTGKWAYAFSQPAIDWLGRVGTACLMWFLRIANYRQDDPSLSGTGSTSGGSALEPINGIAAGGSGPVASWIAAAAGVLICLAGLAVLVYLLWMLLRRMARLRWLGVETTIGNPGGLTALLKAALKALKKWSRILVRWLCRNRQDLAGTEVLAGYRFLLRWGRRRGQPRQPCETPYEYQARLAERFPQAAPEMTLITNAYVDFCYGAADVRSADSRRDLQRALGELRRAGSRR